MTSKRYLTPAEAGEIRGVTAQAVRNQMKEGRPLRPALSSVTGNAGARLLDSHHPAFMAWLGSRGPGRVREEPRVQGAASLKLAALSPAEIAALSETIAALTDKYGQNDVVYQWAKVRKELAQANAAELKRDEYQGKLISRGFVSKHVRGLLDGLSRRLLTETAHTLAKRLGKLSRAGAALPECKRLAADLIGETIAQVKTEAIRAIRNLEGEREEDDAA